MNWDFSNEEEQTETTRLGPVPAGSIVMTDMKLIEPLNRIDEPYVKVAQSGLRMLYVELTVTRGQYADVSWRQHIMLPCGMQRISLSPGQETACRIGGATLKAILQAAGKPLNIQSPAKLDGLTFPVKVKINPRALVSRAGYEYWVNEIAKVITPDMREYAEAQKRGEIINREGAISGQTGGDGKAAPPFISEPPLSSYDDEVPF